MCDNGSTARAWISQAAAGLCYRAPLERHVTGLIEEEMTSAGKPATVVPLTAMGWIFGMSDYLFKSKEPLLENHTIADI